MYRDKVICIKDYYITEYKTIDINIIGINIGVILDVEIYKDTEEMCEEYITYRLYNIGAEIELVHMAHVYFDKHFMPLAEYREQRLMEILNG